MARMAAGEASLAEGAPTEADGRSRVNGGGIGGVAWMGMPP